MNIGFIRHGTTNWNQEKRAQGSADIPLNAQGVNEAELVSRRLCSDEWDVIYSSDLSRAQATAEAISHNIPKADFYLDKRLRERDVGLIEGMTEYERITKWGDDWSTKELGMEQTPDVVARSLEFLHEVVAVHDSDQNILVVSHGGVIKRLLAHLFPDIDQRISLGNTSISQISVQERWTLTRYNCTKHLGRTVNQS